ncbi:MAG: ATP synthase F0 subunit B [Syntrophobacterales bacterium]|nr:ATP synthase F0 subunit B [Syntrophobacterales bacterium]
MLEINSTLWIQIANFLIMIFLLNFLLFKPILNVMERRKNHLQDLDEEVKSLDSEVKKKMADYEEKLREARLEAMNQKNEIQLKASEEGKGVIDETRREISQIVEESNKKMDKEIAIAMEALKSQSEKISVEISEKILGRSI